MSGEPEMKEDNSLFIENSLNAAADLYNTKISDGVKFEIFCFILHYSIIAVEKTGDSESRPLIKEVLLAISFLNAYDLFLGDKDHIINMVRNRRCLYLKNGETQLHKNIMHSDFHYAPVLINEENENDGIWNSNYSGEGCEEKTNTWIKNIRNTIDDISFRYMKNPPKKEEVKKVNFKTIILIIVLFFGIILTFTCSNFSYSFRSLDSIYDDAYALSKASDGEGRIKSRDMMIYAAEKDHPKAQEMLSYWYVSGRYLVPQDYEKADYWKKKYDENKKKK